MQLNLETILPIIIGIVTVIGNLIVAYQRKGSLTAVDVLTGVTTLFKPRDPIASNPDSVHSNAVVKVEEKPRFIYPSQDPENYKSVDGFRKISTGELYQDLPVKEKFSLHTIVKEIADEINNTYKPFSDMLGKRIIELATKNDIANTLCWINIAILIANQIRVNSGQNAFDIKNALKRIWGTDSVGWFKNEAGVFIPGTTLYTPKIYEALLGREAIIKRYENNLMDVITQNPEKLLHLRLDKTPHSTGIVYHDNRVHIVDTAVRSRNTDIKSIEANETIFGKKISFLEVVS